MKREFDPGGLLELAPQTTYTASVVDKGTGVPTPVITETITSASAFAGKEGEVSLAAGQEYSIRLDVETTSTIVGVSLGTTSLRFDNIGLSDPPNGGEEEGGGGEGGGAGGGGSSGGGGLPGAAGGAGAAGAAGAAAAGNAPRSGGSRDGSGGSRGGAFLTEKLLRKLGRHSLFRHAFVRGRRIFVKVRCPKRAGRSCRIGLRGFIGRKGRATTHRNVRVRNDGVKRVVLRVKPRFRRRVAKRRALRIREVLRVGKRRTVIHKRIRLVRLHRR